MAGAPSPECRFVAVLNKKIETGRLLNALGHTTAGLVSLAPDAADMRFLDYRDADGSSHPAISHHPFIVLSADNSNQLRTLRAACMERGIVCNDFVNSMVVPIPE